MMNDLLKPVESAQPVLAESLRSMVNNFQHEELWSLLEQVM
jgi:hypothetical protein